MQNNKWKIIYAGLDVNTFFQLLNYDNFRVCAIAHIEKFNVFSLNPVNHLFRVVYLLRKGNKYRVLENFLFFIWRLLMSFSSGVYFKYRTFLSALCERKISVLDLEDLKKYQDYVEKNNIDLLITSVWPLLSVDIISAPKYKSINIHPSKLPQYRGALPTLWSLKNKDTKSAVTYMVIDPTMDTGNIIAQHEFDIEPKDDWHSMELKIAEVINSTFVHDVEGFLLGEIIPKEQDPTVIASKTQTYDKYRKIDWHSDTAVDVYNKVNLYPFLDPGVYCYTKFKDKEINLYKVHNSKFTKKPLQDIGVGEFVVFFPFVFIRASDDHMRLRLFLDLDFMSSMVLLLNNSGSFVQTMR